MISIYGIYLNKHSPFMQWKANDEV